MDFPFVQNDAYGPGVTDVRVRSPPQLVFYFRSSYIRTEYKFHARAIEISAVLPIKRNASALAALPTCASSQRKPEPSWVFGSARLG